MIIINSYVFRHHSEHLQRSTKPMVHQTNNPIPILIALTVNNKILQIPKLKNFQTSPQSCHTDTCYGASSSSSSQMFIFCASLYVIQRYLVL